MILFCTSCQKKYDLDACNDLSMKKFKGFTDARKKFADHCTHFEVKYSEKLCQSALNELILNNNLAEIKTKYGDPIENCFNNQDLKKYNKN